jgi:hypothetical protein
MRQQPAGTTSDPLAELRDIHLPEVVSGWPPAIGWWILAGLGLIAIGFLSFLLIQRFQRSAYRRRAQRELSAIEEQFKRSENSKAALAALQQVLKRTALAAYSREQVAGLTGYEWTAFLDQSGSTTQFSLGIGEQLIDAPYKSAPELSADDMMALFALCQQWVRQHHKALPPGMEPAHA